MKYTDRNNRENEEELLGSFDLISKITVMVDIVSVDQQGLLSVEKTIQR
ncbi:hypothetical protein GTO89_07500 [Heliobacterium gestii]|uniref:Uncharacterized protein n=1 Tax=Heliomicrobium gestii TaxID=2699 RepID=A0A845LC19_HELGE|nr:hypothetical protein [Heliomicrobium gestii]MBM7866330.1 hypothetical protein [Heliomicrobium gestii]MZP42884.1 hypothetical protein [Heliomicrobium gestii]